MAADVGHLTGLRSGPEARNHLRRAVAGIELLRDGTNPMRDGVSLSADVFLPTRTKCPVPVLRALGIYGKAFGLGSAVTPEQVREAEIREDDWFEGDRSSLPWILRYTENLNSANTFDWVPRGYVAVRLTLADSGSRQVRSHHGPSRSPRTTTTPSSGWPSSLGVTVTSPCSARLIRRLISGPSPP